MAKDIGTHTLTVIRKPKVDRLDPNPATETRHDVDGCAIAPRTSNEEGKGWVILEGRTIFAPYGSDIVADDRIEIDTEDGVWNIDGAPGNYETKRAKPKAMILYLTKVS